MTTPPSGSSPAFTSAQNGGSDSNATPSVVTPIRGDDVQDIETSQVLQGGGDADDGEPDHTVLGSGREGDDHHSGKAPANTPSSLVPPDSDTHDASSDEHDDLADMIARIREKEALKQQATKIQHISPSAVGSLPSEKLRFLSVLASDPQYQRLLNWFREQQVSMPINCFSS